MPRLGWHSRAAVAVLAAALQLSGCVARRPGLTSLGGAAAPVTGPATLTLDQITPVPALPMAAPRPPGSDEPPLDALLLFARARAAAQDGRRFMAVALLEDAIALDPSSYELYYELGRARRDGIGYDPKAAAAFERAAVIEPDHLDAQLDLGRQHLANNDDAEALRRFRLAALTTDYAGGDARSAEADFLLAHTLRELGYDQAALDRYQSLIARLDRGDAARFGGVGGALGTRLFVQVGDLYLRRNRPADALAAYRRAQATADGADDAEVQGRLVRALMLGGRVDEGLALAADGVRRSGAAPAALALLRDAHAAIGKPEGGTQALADLHRRSPQDRAVLFALCEAMVAAGRSRAADDVLAAAWQRSPGDPRLLAGWFRLRFEHAGPPAAAGLLIETLAEHPDLAEQVGPIWRRLLSADGRRKLPIDQLARLAVPPGDRAAHQYVVWRVARDWPRSSLARTALDAAAAARPTPFPPAHRARLQVLLGNDRLPRAARIAAATDLASTADQAGDPGLADELRGQVALFGGDAAAAVDLLVRAVERSPDAPEPRLRLAEAMRAAGGTANPASGGATTADAATAAAWKVIRQLPAYEAGYAHLADHGGPDEAEKALAAWKSAQPPGEPPDPALVGRQAEDQLARGRTEAAELLLAGVDGDDAADDRLLTAARRVHARSGRPDAFVESLERRLGDLARIGPAGLTRVARQLATIYTAADRRDDAIRVLDFARAAVGDEPDLLFELAALYRRAGGTEAAERALVAATAADPQHPLAAAALAGLWADEDRNLDAAESLARRAAELEPADPLLRGTVGWVLLRLGRPAEAKIELLRAVALSRGEDDDHGRSAGSAAGNPGRADPVLLDRAGDAMYRLGERDAAGRSWEQAHRRLADPDVAASPTDDARALWLTLPRKLQQLRAGQDVQVAG